MDKRIHKELEKLLNDSDQNYDYVIFTDVRFLDELLYIKNLGGEVFKVIRQDIEMNEYSKHEAERGIDGEEFNKCVIILFLIMELLMNYLKNKNFI